MKKSRTGPLLWLGLVAGLLLSGAVGSSAAPIITEFLAADKSRLADEENTFPGWIEITNPDSAAANMDGWYLSDDALNLPKWRFPAVSIPAGGAIVVFASGKNRVTAGQPLHANFRIKQDGGYLALVQPNGTTVASVYSGFPPQFEDISYGKQTGGAAVGYFCVPTPKAPNAADFELPIATLQFSPAAGVYDNDSTVTITCATPGSTIFYTLDGSEPVPGAGNTTTYTGPIGGAGTKIVRAIATAAGYRSAPVVTRTYVSIASVRQQPGNPAGFPATWSTYPDDYADAYGIPHNTPVPANYTVDGPLLAENTAHLNQDLKDLPTISIVGNVNDLFGAQGFYSNPWGTHGIEWERKASVEFISKPQYGQGPGFQLNCGVRLEGGGSREPKLAKHSMRVFFRQEYGTDRLRYQLFPRPFESQTTSPANAPEFGSLTLHGYINDGWSWQGGDFGHGTYLRDIWTRDTHAEMGRFACKGTYAHLYLNGLYWGLYQIGEQPEPVTLASRLGGLPEDYDVLKGDDEVTTVPATSIESGNSCAWDQMWTTVAALDANPSDAAQYANLAQVLDIDAFVDYMIVNFYAANYDWPHKNWFAFRQRVAGGKFNFVVWDAEWTMLTDAFVLANADRVVNRPGGAASAKNYVNSPIRIFDILSGYNSNPQFSGGNATFKAAFANRLQKHLFNNGALSLARCQLRWDTRYTEVYPGMTGETIRYGRSRYVPDARWGVPAVFRRDNPWIGYTTDGTGAWDGVRNDFFPQRSPTVSGPYAPGLFLAQMQAHNLFPTVRGPDIFASFVFQIPSDSYEGRVAQGLMLAAGADFIAYTTDGTDPMSAASQFVPPVVFNSWTSYSTLRARAKTGNTWSPIVEARLAPYTGVLVAPQYTRVTGSGVDTVTLLNSNGQGRLYYTLDGSDPGVNGFTGDPLPGTRDYVGPLQITRPVKLRARVELPNNTVDSNFRGGALLSVDLSPTFPVAPVPNNYAGLQVTEIMYNPPGDDDTYEFLELKNTGTTTLDLSGLRFSEGITYSFPCTGALLAPNQFYVIATSSGGLFTTRYGRAPDGVYLGNLSNGGERLTLETATGYKVFSFSYGVAAPWPVVGGAAGHSIVRTGDYTDPSLSSSWRASAGMNGSIGADDTAAFGHSLGREFSVPNNPSLDGRWRYGYVANLGGAFTPVPVQYNGSTADDGTPIPAWQYSSYQTPAFYVNNSGHTVTAGGGMITMYPDDVWFYPGDNINAGNYGVVRYQVAAGEEGRYQILALVQAVYLGWFSTGDTDFHVLRNGVEIHGNQLPGGGSDGFVGTLSLAVNDTIDFVVGRGADNSSYASGLRIRAFLQKVQQPGALDPAHSVNSEFTPASNNPGQRWRYGYAECLSAVNFTAVTFPSGSSTADDGTPIPSWQFSAVQTPAFYWNNSTHTIKAGGIATFVPQTVWFYPGENGLPQNYGIIRYTVPAGEDGLYSLGAIIESVFLAWAVGDTDFYILKNGVRIDSRWVPVNSWAMLPHTLQLSAGDTVDFVVGRGADGSQYASGLKIWLQLTRLP